MKRQTIIAGLFVSLGIGIIFSKHRQGISDALLVDFDPTMNCDICEWASAKVDAGWGFTLALLAALYCGYLLTTRRD